MASDQFYLFAALASFSRDFQDQLRRVQTPEAILVLAAEHGFEITLQQLRFYSVNLTGDHWVWAQKGEEWRKQFFASEQQLHLHGS